MAEPSKWTYLMDMDGVLVHEEHLIPGTDKLLDELRAKEIKFLVLTNRDPDYVVLGETRTYSFTAITTAIRLVEQGARFIATNPDATGPTRDGSLPATGSVAALIEKAAGHAPYFVGKPNPLMMRSALNTLGAHSESTLMIGDRMDTDVRSGLEAGLRTILVLTGISTAETAERFPYRPTRVIDSVGDLVGTADDPFPA